MVRSDDTSVERGGSADFGPLFDHHLVPEADMPVAGQMQSVGTGGRARRGILGDSLARGKHARLPALAVPGEDAEGGASKRRKTDKVRTQGFHLLGGPEFDEHVVGAVVVELDRQSRAFDSQRGKKPGRGSEWLDTGQWLIHPTEYEASLLPSQSDGDDALRHL